MKKLNYIKTSVFVISISVIGCAATDSSNQAVATADSSLATAGQTAQSGGQIVDSGVTAANQAVHNSSQVIESSASAANEAVVQSGQQIVDSGTNQVLQGGAQALGSGAVAANSLGAGQGALVNSLVNQLGVSPQQALGGAGAIFQSAQGSMEPQAFSTLSQSVPGINDMLNAAPALPDSPMASGLSSMMGGGAGDSLGGLASLTSSFQQLNLSPDMVGKFVPVVTDYVRTSGGEAAATLLQSALGFVP